MKTKGQRQSKNVEVQTVAQNIHGRNAQNGDIRKDPVQMGGERRVKDKAKQEVVRDMDQAMRAENLRRKNPFVAGMINAIEHHEQEGVANKIKGMFQKTGRAKKK